jgi:hypothetical protein
MDAELGHVIIPSFDPPEAGRSVGLQVLLVSLAIFAILGYVGFLVFTATVSPEERAISYRIEGNVGTARISYTDSDGHQVGATYVSVPWQLPSKLYRSGTQVFLTAGSTQAVGTISCVMLLDGQEWRRDTSSAKEGKVACGGVVP